MQIAQAIYLHPLTAYVSRYLPDSGIRELKQAKQNLHGLFTYSIPLEYFARHVSRFLKQQASVVLGISEQDCGDSEDATVASARDKTAKVMEGLHHVGLAGPKVERLFAEVMNAVLGEFVVIRYTGKWAAPSKIPEELRDWVENRFARFIVEVLSHIREDETGHGRASISVSYADTQKWQQFAIRKLGELRVGELFDIVADWNNGGQGAIEDLSHYVRDGRWRNHLTSEFCEVLSRRLLQPGASTTEILQIYMAIIRSFTILDSRGVLLDRVARPIRRYLRERDDTVTIVVGGLLANTEDDPPVPDVLYELAEELESTGGLPIDENVDDAWDLDFNDMSWEPDPVDAPLGIVSLIQAKVFL